MPRPMTTARRPRVTPADLARRAHSPLETLEPRAMLALSGVDLTSFPFGSFDATGQTSYNAATSSFDVVATPTVIFATDGPHSITATHGDFQIHAKVGPLGNLVRGVNAGDTPSIGDIDAAGNDLVIRGEVDLDANGSAEKTGVLLTGEIYALGSLDTGSVNDRFDFRFVVTGGALTDLYPVGSDLGVTMVSEGSTFEGSFFTSFTGGAKGNFGAIAAPPPASLEGNVYCDSDLSGSLTPGDTGLADIPVRLTGVNDAGQAIDLSTTTDAAGRFAFTNLRAGTYTISETSPANAAEGTNTVGTANGVVVDEDTIGFVLLPGSTNATGYNFGYICLGGFTGKKWLDVTGNGLSADDQPLGGTTIYIDADNDAVKDPGEPSTVTQADGTYAFNGLMPGTYTVREVVPAGYVRTGPTLSDKHTVTLAAGQTRTGFDFANAEKCDTDDLKYVKYYVNGCLVTTLDGNVQQGDTVQVTFTIRSGVAPHKYTLVSYTAPSPTFVASEASQQRIYDMEMGTFGPGTWTLTVHIPDCYFQVDFVCGAAIDVFGPAGSNIFYSAQMRLIAAENGGKTPCVYNASTICGYVFEDTDNDGVKDAWEKGIGGAKVVLSWTQSGVAKTVTRYTDSSGKFMIGNLRAATYKLTETTPEGYFDGKDRLGTASGTLTNDMVSNINLGAGVKASDYTFGELDCDSTVNAGDSASVSFWKGSRGQTLIKSFNGSQNSTALGNWLAASFPNLFGAGSMSLAGKTNAQVASAMVTRAGSSSTSLEAAVLAAALDIYATSSLLGANGTAAYYGFSSSATGSAFGLVNVGSAGSRLGFANSSVQTMWDILAATNANSSNGVVYNGNSTARATLLTLFTSIGSAGGIA